MSFWSKLFFTQQAITHTKNISPYTQNKAIKSEHERLMQEQYAMTHPKCEKETPSEYAGGIFMQFCFYESGACCG